MLKTLSAGALGSLLTVGLLAGAAHANIWNVISTGDWLQVDPSVRYEVDVKGFDIRVYEWPAHFSDKVSCAMVAGEKNTMFHCYDVDPETVARRLAE